MEEIFFTNYDNEFKDELNTWQSKENLAGSNGLNDFVVSESTLLGDYIEFINRSIDDITTCLAFNEKSIVGFLCYSKPEENHTHIEVMGVNPDCRGKGYASKMLIGFKKELEENSENPQNLTLSVNKKNINGINSFSKVAKVSKKQDKENYINFEL